MEIITRKEAFAKGLKKYFTGNPCRRGHFAERYVAGACCACVSDQKKQKYEKNKDKILAYMKIQGAIYRKNNPEKRAENSKKWKQNNQERIRELERKRRAESPEKFNQISRNYYHRNKEKELQRQKSWRSKNKGIVNSFTRQRKAVLLSRVPRWADKEELWLMRQAYELAVLRKKMLGFEWHVDHIYPLQGKLVSGLHIVDNLQVIPAVINLSKGNRVRVG
jgi:hypothetical protein